MKAFLSTFLSITTCTIMMLLSSSSSSFTLAAEFVIPPPQPIKSATPPDYQFSRIGHGIAESTDAKQNKADAKAGLSVVGFHDFTSDGANQMFGISGGVPAVLVRMEVLASETALKIAREKEDISRKQSFVANSEGIAAATAHKSYAFTSALRTHSVVVSKLTKVKAIVYHSQTRLVFAATFCEHARVVKYDAKNLVLVGETSFDCEKKNTETATRTTSSKSTPGISWPVAASSTKTHIYFGSSATDGKIFRFNVASSLKELDKGIEVIIPHYGENKNNNNNKEAKRHPASAVPAQSFAVGGLLIDQNEEYLYVGTMGTAPAKIAKICISSSSSSSSPIMAQKGKSLHLDPTDPAEAGILKSSAMLIDPNSDNKILFVLTAPSTVVGRVTATYGSARGSKHSEDETGTTTLSRYDFHRNSELDKQLTPSAAVQLSSSSRLIKILINNHNIKKSNRSKDGSPSSLTTSMIRLNHFDLELGQTFGVGIFVLPPPPNPRKYFRQSLDFSASPTASTVTEDKFFSNEFQQSHRFTLLHVLTANGRDVAKFDQILHVMPSFDETKNDDGEEDNEFAADFIRNETRLLKVNDKRSRSSPHGVTVAQYKMEQSPVSGVVLHHRVKHSSSSSVSSASNGISFLKNVSKHTENKDVENNDNPGGKQSQMMIKKVKHGIDHMADQDGSDHDAKNKKSSRKQQQQKKDYQISTSIFVAFGGVPSRVTQFGYIHEKHPSFGQFKMYPNLEEKNYRDLINVKLEDRSNETLIKLGLVVLIFVVALVCCFRKRQLICGKLADVCGNIWGRISGRKRVVE